MIFFWWIGFLIVLITIGAQLVSFVKTLQRWDEKTEEKTKAEKTEADKTIDDLNIINSSKRKVNDEEHRIAKQTYEALEDGAGESSPLTKEIFKKVTGYEDNKDDDELAKPLEITDLKSDNGTILGIVKLKSGNFGLGGYSLEKKKWIRIDSPIGPYLHPQYGISSYDYKTIERIKDDMNEEMVHNDIYFKYFFKKNHKLK